jgi:hypothetical protein
MNARFSIPLAMAAAIAAGSARAETRPIALPFIENDQAAAIDRAKAAAKPVFVEVWAPW